MSREYKVKGIYNINCETYIGFTEDEIHDVDVINGESLSDFETITEDGVKIYLIRIAHLLIGDKDADVDIYPTKYTPSSDNIIPPNDDGSYTLKF